jgi:hypothetical protein
MNNFQIPKSRWLGIEAARDAHPVLIRLRVFEKEIPEFPELFVVGWKYIVDEQSQMPSAAFYEKVDRFEREVVDAAERNELGLLVAVETGLGISRHFFYTPSAERLATELDAAIPPDDDVEFATDLDPNWTVHRRFLTMVSQSQSPIV